MTRGICPVFSWRFVKGWWAEGLFGQLPYILFTCKKQVKFLFLVGRKWQLLEPFMEHKEHKEECYPQEWVQWVLTAPLVEVASRAGLYSFQAFGKRPSPWYCPGPGALWILWSSTPAPCPPGHMWWALSSHSTISTPESREDCLFCCIRSLLELRRFHCRHQLWTAKLLQRNNLVFFTGPDFGFVLFAIVWGIYLMCPLG